MPLIDAKLEKLVTYIQEAMEKKNLREKSRLNKEEIDKLKKDYTRKWIFNHGEMYGKEKAEYTLHAKRTIDCIIFDAIPKIFAHIKQIEAEGNPKAIAALTATPSLLGTVFSDRTGNSVLDLIEDLGANSMARYLGRSFVPQYLDDETVFEQMKWLEWLLRHLLPMVGKEVHNIGIGDLSTKGQLNLRLEGTEAFLKKYLENNPKNAEDLNKFHESYLDTKTNKLKCLEKDEQISDQTIDNNFQAAMNVKKVSVVQEREALPQNTF